MGGYVVPVSRIEGLRITWFGRLIRIAEPYKGIPGRKGSATKASRKHTIKSYPKIAHC